MFAWQATVQNEMGNIVVLPVITVYTSDGVTLADIFDDAGVALANPLTGTMEGFVQFWAASGEYRIVGADGPAETAEWSVFLGVPEQVDITTRAEMVLAIADGFVPVDSVTYWLDGLAYIGATGVSDISDMPGMLPVDPRPEHFGSVTPDATLAVTAWLNYVLTHPVTGYADDIYNMASGHYVKTDVVQDVDFKLSTRARFIGGDFAAPVIDIRTPVAGLYSFNWFGGGFDTTASPFVEAVQAGTALNINRFRGGEITGATFIVNQLYSTLMPNGDVGISGVDITGMRVHHNHFDGFPDAAIYWGGNSSMGATDDGGLNIISENTFRNCWQFITLKRQMQNVLVCDNVGTEVRSFASLLGVTGVAPAFNVTFADNFVSKVERRAFVMQSVGKGLRIIDNTIVDWGYLQDGVTLSSGREAIYLQGVHGADISGNRMSFEAWAETSGHHAIRYDDYTFDAVTYNCEDNTHSDNTMIGGGTFIVEDAGAVGNGGDGNMLISVTASSDFATGSGSWVGFRSETLTDRILYISEGDFRIRINGHNVRHVVAQGSNSNGAWVQYSDGTMECSHTLPSQSTTTVAGSGFVSADEKWTFPNTANPFITGPALTIDIPSTTRWPSHGSISTTAVNVSQNSWASSATAVAARIRAVGRWE